MKNRYSIALLLSSLFMLFGALIFSVFGIWPLYDFFTNNLNPGHIIAILSIPISFLIFVISVVLFLVFLIKFFRDKKRKSLR